jgi:membrane protein DedA with SNARE-associated domain
MSLEPYVQQIIDFVRLSETWAPLIVFALALGESLAFISFLLPAWAALVAIGGLVGVSGIQFWPFWIAASIGAAVGDWVLYWIGLKLETAVYRMWPLSSRPDLIPKSETFVKRWGMLGIFIGRFFGPCVLWFP